MSTCLARPVVSSSFVSTQRSRLTEYLHNLSGQSITIVQSALCSAECWMTRRKLAHGALHLVVIPGGAVRLVSHDGLHKAVRLGGARVIDFETAISSEYQTALNAYLASLLS